MIMIQTISGKRIDLENIRASDIDIEDMAHHLAYINRWNGADAFSVAQHSVLVAQLVPVELAFKALLHDGSDYLMGDMVSPLKHHPGMKFFADLEAHVQDVIYGAFGLTPGTPIEIKAADWKVQAMESRDLMKTPPAKFRLPDCPTENKLVCWPAELAKTRFMAAFSHFSIRQAMARNRADALGVGHGC